MAERRHNGGGMEREAELDFDLDDPDVLLDNFDGPFGPFGPRPDDDPVTVNLSTGIVDVLCYQNNDDDDAIALTVQHFGKVQAS